MTLLVFARICIGKHFTLRTVYLVVACVLSVFDIEPASDENGNLQMPKAEFRSGFVRCVPPAPSNPVIGMLTIA